MQVFVHNMMEGDVNPSTAEHASGAGAIGAERDTEDRVPLTIFVRVYNTQTEAGS